MWGYAQCTAGFGSCGPVTVPGPDLAVPAGDGSLTVSDGGAVTARTLFASLADLHGNGTITATAGGILDADLRFDATRGSQAIAALVRSTRWHSMPSHSDAGVKHF